jgi:hypothetical protein
MSHLSIITINYRAAATTAALLRTLFGQLGEDADLLIIDNNSGADDRALLGAESAAIAGPVEVIFNRENRGFSGGCNMGIRKALSAGATWVLLLNNDTTVPQEFVQELCSQTAKLQPGCYGIPLREQGTVHRAGIVRWLQMTLASAQQPPQAARIYIVGGGMLIHRDVLERCGLLDERYFLYFEDADYSERVRRAGFPVGVLTRPVAEHAVSLSTSKLGSALLLRYHARNAILFNALHAPRWHAMLLPGWISWVATKQVLKLLLRRNTEASRAILAGVGDALLARWGRIDTRPCIAIECESLEDTSWGVARVIRGLLESYSSLPDLQARYRLRLYCKRRIPSLPSFPAGTVECVRVPSAGSFSLYYYVLLPLRLWWDRPAVTYWPNYMLPIIAPSPSVVMLTEDVLYEARNPLMPLRYRYAYRIFTGWAIRRATRIMAISASSAARLRHLVPAIASRLFVNQLAMTPILPQPAPDTTKYILYAAQGLPRRHLRETILGFAEVARRYPALHLIAVGADKYRPLIIKALVEETNRMLGRNAIRWIERVSEAELASLMHNAQALVYVSDMEAFGLPPLEALSCGVVPIVLDVPVHHEILGEHAVYVQSAQPAAIAAAIEQALNDTALRAGVRSAARSVASRYTWDAHADRFFACVDALLR